MAECPEAEEPPESGCEGWTLVRSAVGTTGWVFTADLAERKDDDGFLLQDPENICDDCGGELYQRGDDTAETMQKRLKVYEASTRPLIEYYKAAGVYSEIDGRQPIEKVTEDLKRVLNSVKE